MLPNDARKMKDDIDACTIAGVSVYLDFAKGERTQGERLLAVETPLSITYGGMPFAVMMVSPADLEDFVTGFSLTEGIVESRDDLRGISVERLDDAIKVDVSLAPARMHHHLARARTMAGRTGCGVCGISDLAALPRRHAPLAGALAISPAAIERALHEVDGAQALDRVTRAMHAAAWCSADGEILCVREDVGRHNALDKLIGALLREGVPPDAGFVLITSRASFEMVEKTAMFGASCLVAISAPTSLAVARAKAHGITLVGVARKDGASVFNGVEAVHSGGFVER